MSADLHCPSIAVGLQLGLWPSRSVSIWASSHTCKPKPPPPQTKRGCRRLLTPAVTKAGTRVTIRLGPREAKALAEVALEQGMTLSEVLRDSLYEAYRIGELEDEATH